MRSPPPFLQNGNTLLLETHLSALSLQSCHLHMMDRLRRSMKYLSLEHGLDLHEHGSRHQNPGVRILALPPRRRRREAAPAGAPPAAVLQATSRLLSGAFVVYAPDVLLPPRRRLAAPGGARDGGPRRRDTAGGGGPAARGGEGEPAAAARAQARGRLHALLLGVVLDRWSRARAVPLGECGEAARLGIVPRRTLRD